MELLKDVQKYFPIKEFRFSQKQIIEQILSGRDVLAVLPTGTGKSLCYQYPALKLPGITLVISPLIALMEDQTKHLKGLNIPAACLNKDVPGKERRKIPCLCGYRYRFTDNGCPRFREAMLDSTSYLKEIEDNAKLTEKHLQIIKQQTADTEELITE